MSTVVAQAAALTTARFGHSDAMWKKITALQPAEQIRRQIAAHGAMIDARYSAPMPAKKTSARKNAAKKWVPAPKFPAGEEHLQRVRRICSTLPETTEKPSHGEPTFFVRKRVYCMFANNHHDDGHLAVWIAAPPGLQAMLVQNEPAKFFRPPYVGVAGWIGIELPAIGDEELAAHLLEAWRLIETKQKPKKKSRAAR